MRVERRQVYRWFTGGKGFHNETAAYRYLAKRALGEIIHRKAAVIAVERGCDPTWIETTREDAVAAYVEIFPHSEDASCIEENCTGHRWGEHSSSGTSYTGNFAYPWCKTAYRKWIGAKIKELREADGK